MKLMMFLFVYAVTFDAGFRGMSYADGSQGSFRGGGPSCADGPGGGFRNGGPT